MCTHRSKEQRCNRDKRELLNNVNLNWPKPQYIISKDNCIIFSKVVCSIYFVQKNHNVLIFQIKVKYLASLFD